MLDRQFNKNYNEWQGNQSILIAIKSRCHTAKASFCFGVIPLVIVRNEKSISAANCLFGTSLEKLEGQLNVYNV